MSFAIGYSVLKTSVIKFITNLLLIPRSFYSDFNIFEPTLFEKNTDGRLKIMRSE